MLLTLCRLPVPVVPISEARCTMGARTKDKMPLIIAARDRVMVSRRERWKDKRLCSANQTLLLWPLITWQTEGGRRRDTWGKRTDRKWGGIGRESNSRAALLEGVGLHLCATPGCYRASVYSLFIPLPLITTQWAALFSSAPCNNSWAILAWHTSGSTPKVRKNDWQIRENLMLLNWAWCKHWLNRGKWNTKQKKCKKKKSDFF